jgi:SpoVK/Ycf46/Vps4 family AAA+-type ATPase
MLPELQKLHDSPLIIPIFATNHISKFDRAGRRPGRFDYILPVGLPSPEERRAILQRFLPKGRLFNGIEEISEGATVRQLLDWAREYRDQGKPGNAQALAIWKNGFDQLKLDAIALKKFEDDISKFAYPPGVI